MLSCTFAGHRNVFLPDADRKIEVALDWLIARDDAFVFYTGGMGEFDIKCASAVRAAKRRHIDKEIRLILVLPYMSNCLNTDKNYYESSFDDVMIPIELVSVYPKAAIQKRNRWMVDRSDYLIACVHRDFGGAYETVQYAMRKDVPVLNLAQQASLQL
ncbi:MAG: DUF1273 domain-containing protein [Oscillospiraceae bacterium]|nr:DUF1273 domain-containing protein [Oscillospiraceae bacterium]